MISKTIIKRKKARRVKIMSSENKKKDCTDIIIGFMFAGCIWSDKNKTGLRYIRIFATISFLSTNALQLIALINARDDQTKLYECASILTFCSMGILKLMSLTRNASRWKKNLNRMKKLETKQLGSSNSDIEYNSDDCEQQESFITDLISKYTKVFKLIIKLLSRLYSLTLAVFVASPFLEFGILILIGKECSYYPHVLPIWTPFDNISLLGYLATLTFEFVAAIYCVIVHICFDVISVGVMIFVCGQYELLKEYSSRIAGKGNSCMLSKRRDERALSRISKCRNMHTELITVIMEQEELIRTILGVYYVVATSTLLSVAIQLKSTTLSVTQLISLFQYTFATLFQLYLYCHFGNSVYYGSSIGMGEGPNASAYWCLSPGVRKQILMLNFGLMKSRRLRAGPFNNLDLPSFVQIVRTAYSYYAVLNEKSH